MKDKDINVEDELWKAAVKNAVISVMDGKVSYKEIEQLPLEVMNHAMTIYATA